MSKDVSHAVSLLANKFNFDYEEAIELVTTELNKLKLEKKNKKQNKSEAKFELSLDSIECLTNCAIEDNDDFNKRREHLITLVANKQIPEHYYENPAWASLRDNLNSCIQELAHRIGVPANIEYALQFKPKGGRTFNYDFDVIFTENCANDTKPRVWQAKLEFKYNVTKIADTPQFVSPMKPSQYLSESYEEFFYDNYLPKIAALMNLPIPERDLYLSKIHNNNPEFMIPFKHQYHKGCPRHKDFSGDEQDTKIYSRTKEIARESIEKFIEQSDLLKDKLEVYLQGGQDGKIYMMYKDGTFNLESMDPDNYILEDVIKEPSKNRYVCRTKSGLWIGMLLRWKNGNGIAFPAFQVSVLRGGIGKT